VAPRKAACIHDPDDLREIAEATSTIEIHGARYPDYLEAHTGR
jgi:hypothetical protein